MDTRLFKTQDGAVHIITFKGSTVNITFHDDGGDLVGDNITFGGQVRDMNNTLIGSFSFTKDVPNKKIYVTLSSTTTSLLVPLDRYYTVQEIADNEYTFDRYKYDIEMYDSSDNSVHKLIYGFIYVLPEVTTT